MFDYNTLIGRQIDQFRLDQFIARGAMGLVLRAFDTVLVRTVALKLIPKGIETAISLAEASAMEVARKRLVQEAKAAGRLSHPSIVTIHSYGETDEFEYICMEYVKGVTLAQILQSRKTLPVEEAVSTFGQVLPALEAAHSQKIVHRDIKPSNIMVTDDKRVKVMDFGIAKLPSLSATMSMTMTVLGTPYYMSPEQISGQRIDRRSDIFSLGAVFYESLTGEKPFLADNTATLAYKIVQTEPVPPRVLDIHIPQNLSSIVMKALAKDPAQRYQTAAEMLSDLRGPTAAAELRADSVPSFPDERGPAGEGTALQTTLVVVAHESSKPAKSVTGTEFAADDRQTDAMRRQTGNETVHARESESRRMPEPSPEPGLIEEEANTAARDAGKAKPFDPILFARGIRTKLGDWPVVVFSVVFALSIVVLGFALIKKGPAGPGPGEPATGRGDAASTQISFTPGASTPGQVPSGQAPSGNQPQAAVKLVPAAAPAPVAPVAQPAPAILNAPLSGQVASVEEFGPLTEQSKTSADNLVESAKAFFSSNPAEAKKLLLNAMELDPENFEAYMQLGRLLTFNKDYEGAIRQYGKALSINNQVPEIYFNLGFIYMNRRSFQLARENYESCLALSPSYRDEVLTNLGIIESREGNTAAARKFFAEALELKPENVIAKKHLLNLDKAARKK